LGKVNYSNVWKNCATCDCWDGERQANEAKDTVTVDSAAVGACNGFWQGRRKYGNDKCPEWKMWSELTSEVVKKHRVWPPVDD